MAAPAHSQAETERKAAHMRLKTEEMRRAANLTESEDCIQDYHCAFGSVNGRMYISQNHIVFAASIGSTLVDILFRKVKGFKKSRNLLLDNAIIIEFDGSGGLESQFFSGFVHRDETFNLLDYIWRNPPIILDLPPPAVSNAALPPVGDGGQSNGAAPAGSAGSRDRVSSGSGSNPFDSDDAGGGGGGGQRTVSVKVDTQSSRNALRLAQQAREIGAATLVDLTMQAEQLDRVEYSVEVVNANMDRSKRLMRGIESVGGSIANSLSKDQTPGPGPFKPIDRTLNLQQEENFVDFAILQKLKNDHLQPATMRFYDDQLLVLDEAKKASRSHSWSYKAIAEVAVRARPFHLDIRFSDKKIPRFRFCSSFMQAIVNELYARVGKEQLVVTFEPNSKQFQYGRREYTDMVLTSGRTRDQELSTNGFFRPSQRRLVFAKASETILKDVDNETKAALDQQDDDLDEISNILGDLHGIANVMGQEIDRSAEQVARINKRADDANVKLHAVNRRIDKQL